MGCNGDDFMNAQEWGDGNKPGRQSFTLAEILESGHPTFVDTCIILGSRHPEIPYLPKLLAKHPNCSEIPKDQLYLLSEALSRRLEVVDSPSLFVTEKIFEEVHHAFQSVRERLHAYRQKIVTRYVAGQRSLLERSFLSRSRRTTEVTGVLGMLESYAGNFHRLVHELNKHVYAVQERLFDDISRNIEANFFSCGSSSCGLSAFLLKDMPSPADVSLVTAAYISSFLNEKPAIIISRDRHILELLQADDFSPRKPNRLCRRPNDHPIALYMPNTRSQNGRYHLVRTTLDNAYL